MLGKCIGVGSSCEVYEWDGEEKAVKLFHTNTSREEVELEYRNSAAAWGNGLPAARPFEQLEWDNRYGIVFEKVVGPTFVNRFFEQLYAFQAMDYEYADSDLRKFARVLHDIHSGDVSGIATEQKGHLKAIIGRPSLLTDEELVALHNYIDQLPDKRRLCHGDTNVNNFILRDTAPVMIDWMHAAIGNPAADVAEVCVTILYAVLPPETPPDVNAFFETSRETACRIFVDEYCNLSGISAAEIRPWHVPVAARQLSSGALSDEQERKLVALIRTELGL
ncbi:phosphotransferase family protein [Paenibacillus sp. YIM B09110]|uniref:phosphotransferase family protein n=1 Tax=Paenibacillus sp. YIM B09110 TaxID=3126102 RepID=UPI00301CFD23